MTALSAIIPTRDRPDLLADALATLAAQAIEPGALEVIVIDDGSEPNLQPVLDAAAASSTTITFRYARQDPGGLNAGRNHGAAIAHAPLLAFLDDDVLVDPGWAQALLDTFATSGCDAVAGRTRLQLEGPEPAWLTGKLRLYLSELDFGEAPRWLDGRGETPVGANCAVRRDRLDALGGFAAGLDREGASLVSNGDTEFFRRVAAAGGRIRYAPGVHVLHRVPAARLTTEWFLRRAKAQGVSDAMLERDSSVPVRNARAREVLRAGRALPILARNLLDGRGTVAASIWLAYCRGRFGAITRPHPHHPPRPPRSVSAPSRYARHSTHRTVVVEEGETHGETHGVRS